MVLSYKEQVELVNLKHQTNLEFMERSHALEMVRLKAQLEIAKAGNKNMEGYNGSDDRSNKVNRAQDSKERQVV